uniref:VWFA domain-containing protein n=1 Tax=Panagrellus redivivus TaxID=6233 RepID=A0A7E4VBN4_PANRE
MRKVVVLLLYTCVLVSFATLLKDETSNLCQQSHPKPSMWCPIALTFAVDFSTRMGSQQNVANLVYSVVAEVLPMYVFKSSSLMVSLIAFGQTDNYTVDLTPFHQNYTDICEDVVQEEEDSRKRRHDASLRFVYKEYYYNITQNLPRKTQKVLVVFTAINDPNDVLATQFFADKLRKDYGVFIIAVYLGSENGQHLATIADRVWATCSYRLPVDVVREVVKASCMTPLTTVAPTTPSTVKTSTHTPSTPTPSTPSTHPTVPTTTTAPLNKLDGVPCATNTTSAWLDIAIVVEETEITTKETFRDAIQSLLKTYISRLTISANITTASRIAVINYNKSMYASVRHSFSDSQSEAAILQVLNGLNKQSSKDAYGNIEAGLKLAQTEFNLSPNNRVKTIILVATTYDKLQDPLLTAEILKADRVTIITVFFGELSNSPDDIANLSSPGMAFRADSMTLNDMTHSLAIANCQCPSGWTQLNYSNSTHYVDPLGECFFAVDILSLPVFVECPEGSMVTITSERRLKFLETNVITEGLGLATDFSIGLSRDTQNDPWQWSTVDGPIDYTGYPRFSETPHSEDISGYLQLDDGAWSLHTDDAYTDSRPYICQRKACDAENYCEIEE